MAQELNGHGADEPLSALDRDHLVFVMQAMEERAAMLADCIIDEIETRNKAKDTAA